MTAPTAGEAPYDWILTYETARAGGFGDQSQAVIDRIKQDNPNFQDLVDKGILRSPDQGTRTVTNESGTFDVPDTMQGSDSIDWSKLPAMPSAPKGTGWEQISTNGSTGAIGDFSGELGYYNDPNYGELGLKRQHDPADWTDYLGMAVAAFAGGATAGPLAASIGASEGLGAAATAALRTGISTGITSAATGQAPNPFSSLVNLLKPYGPDFGQVISGIGGGG